MIAQDDKSYYVGIDVSKNALDIFILPINKHMQFVNNPKDLQKIVKKLLLFPNALIVMESTGGYERPIAQALAKASLSVAVLNPRQIRDFGKALGILAKTDKIDAQLIALFAEKIKPVGNIICNETNQKISAINARRRQLIEMIMAEKHRLDKVPSSMQKSIGRIIKALEKELDVINAMLRDIIATNAEYDRKNKLLQSIKGVGAIVAANFISDLPELGQLESKQIAALVGVAPYNCDSGSFRGKRAIWGGRAHVRGALYMAALVAIQHNTQIKIFYDRLVNNGKNKKVALIACMRKLLTIMNAMLKYKKQWKFIMSR